MNVDNRIMQNSCASFITGERVRSMKESDANQKHYGHVCVCLCGCNVTVMRAVISAVVVSVRACIESDMWQ